ncbi:urokinase plasminogen activator surface receptor-like [Dendropsophus ebraccatus]|uniref:urokinase plasminogen activator surface receptor-like n=1 Tax=Dendropsophus ebraccatus TaxID=150705 RepID=UPI0038318DD9
MKVVQRLLCLLAPFIVTGQALTCTSCVSLNGCEPNCTSSSSVQCSSSELCSTTYRKKSQNGRYLYDIIRSCTPRERCGMVGGLSYADSKMSLGIGCCSTDGCTPVLPQLTQDASVSNGVQCGTCSSSQSTSCQTTGNIMCHGNETQCVTYSETVSGESWVFRGCGSSSLCKVPHHTTRVFGVAVEHSFTCMQNGVQRGGVTPGILLTALICAVLMNYSM